MITYLTGDVLFSKCQTLVNPINCKGAMGKGLALRFKKRFPGMYEKYKDYCNRGLISPGKLWLYKGKENWVLNFPTKDDWRNPSKEEYIISGLEKFLQTYEDKGIKSIAFPLLGTGEGGLDRTTIVQLLDNYLSRCEIPVEVYTGYVPRSPMMIDCLERLCGQLTDYQKTVIREQICCENDENK